MWLPYLIGQPSRMRPLNTTEGLGDRLRLIAFAERQAFHAFNEAIIRFPNSPKGLLEAWHWVALEEAKHESWLLNRLAAIGQKIEDRPVSLNLYYSLQNCQTPKDFALYISDAEERGRIGAEKFAEVLKTQDPETAEIFKQIALEEKAHIALVDKYF